MAMTVRGLPGHRAVAGRRARFLSGLVRHASGCQAVCQPIRECPCRLQVVVLDVGRRDLDS